MLVVQIAAGVVLGVLVLAWLEKRARHAAEERWRAAQGRISRREAILHPMVTEVYKCFSREVAPTTAMGNGQCRPKNSPASLMKKRLQRLMCCFQSASTNSKASSCGMRARTKQLSPAFAKPRDGLTKDGTMIYFARKQDCHACALKPQCCPNVSARKIARSVHEAAATRPVRSQRRRPTSSRVANERKSRCSSLI